ncbi:MAG: 3-hydroxy-3-methylglutaryl CoA synthase [Gammaproteobacteria bacterium]|nr:3-hydroxy-3-methylglutaryl CoA synthase [Gammaproteobacteria bacterium]
MKAGITGYGAYIPWRRLSRETVAKANAWFAPNIRGRGHRAVANWDEDSITMAVAAARDLLGESGDRSAIEQVMLASTTMPFADRLNAGLLAEALNLSEKLSAVDISGAQTASLAGLSQALATSDARGSKVLLAAADNRNTLAASPQELSYGDAAAALTLGTDGVIAECLGEAALAVDFVDHFRQSDRDTDYHWEERWVRDEGIARFLPAVIGDVLSQSGVAAAEVNHFIFPTTFKRMDQQLASKCGIAVDAIADNLESTVGDSGAAHGLLMLAQVLAKAQPGELILLCQFGSGARAMLLRVTDAIKDFSPVRGVSGWLTRSVEETNYTRFLAYKGQLQLDKGMRGEQDKKTALSTAYRYRKALLGFVAGRCSVSGDVHFPPTRLSYTPGAPRLDTQQPYPLAEKTGHILSWSAEYLSSDMAPPHQYGQVDFVGGGRLLMDFTDVQKGDIDTGMEVEMVFRIKDIDELRGFKRYFWKATPVQRGAGNKQSSASEEQ